MVAPTATVDVAPPKTRPVPLIVLYLTSLWKLQQHYILEFFNVKHIVMYLLGIPMYVFKLHLSLPLQYGGYAFDARNP